MKPLYPGELLTMLGAPRISRVVNDCPESESLIQQMLHLSVAGLPLMFRNDERTFCFTRKQDKQGLLTMQGVSLRYGAITVLGALYLDEPTQSTLFGGETAAEFTGRLIRQLNHQSNPGDIALVAWGAAELEHSDLPQVLQLLLERSRTSCEGYTVEAAWGLSALSAASRLVDVRKDAERECQRLLSIFSNDSGIFPHYTNLKAAPWYRSHVGCFADQVYPIQALARYSKVSGNELALKAASRCAEQICHLQGKDGQWWWHYDYRTGQVVEGYPVYSVHQDSMAPMALMDLYDAGGPDYAEAIRLGLSWMAGSPEVGRSLIDENNSVIWRKAARSDPRKLVRKLKAGACKWSRNSRLEGLGKIFPPNAIDYECRPYHLGWILHTWLKS
jgi:hypothetical protein